MKKNVGVCRRGIAKKVPCAVLALVLALSLVSCGNKTPDTVKPQAPQQTQPQTPASQLVGTWVRDENSDSKSLHVGDRRVNVESITFYNDGTISKYNNGDIETGEYKLINDGNILVLSLDEGFYSSNFELTIQTDSDRPGVLFLDLDGLLLHKE